MLNFKYVPITQLTTLLVTAGWKWDDDAWLVDADSSGWLYATDFSGPAGYSASFSGSASVKHVHFVRRRVVSRSMKYYGMLHVLLIR